MAKESITTPNDSIERSPSATITQKAKRKVKRQGAFDDEEEDDTDEIEARTSWEISNISARPQKTSTLTGIRLPGRIYPESQYEGWKPPLPKTREIDALNDLGVSLYCLYVVSSLTITISV